MLGEILYQLVKDWRGITFCLCSICTPVVAWMLGFGPKETFVISANAVIGFGTLCFVAFTRENVMPLRVLGFIMGSIFVAASVWLSIK